MLFPLTSMEALLTRDRELRLATGPIVVATDGRVESDAAIQAAWSLVGRTAAEVQVVTVLGPLGPITALAGAPRLTSEFWADQKDAQLAAVRSQLTRLVPRCDWPVAIIQGNTAEAIARQARNLNARIVVLGRGRHGLAARALGGETVQRLVRLAHAPVLAVDAGATSLPRRVVIAVDFSSHSIAAARDALAFVAPDAVVYLVHVRPHARFTGPSTARWERTYDEAVPAFLAVMRDREKQHEETKEEDDRTYYVWERRYGWFQRSLPFPGGINEDKITVEFKDGVLTVHLPKAEEAKARHRAIAISGT